MSNIDLTERHVFLAEDEFLLARNLVRRLQSWGATVVGPASMVAQALDLLAQADRVDLAVLDVNLEGEMVFPVADELNTRRIPFVFTTGYEDSTIPERFRGVSVLQKPVRNEKLAKGILTLLA